MDINAVRKALAASLGVITGLNVYSFIPKTVSSPCLIVSHPERIEMQTMGNSDTEAREMQLKVLLLVESADNESEQDALYSYLSGPLSVRKAITSDLTLNGTCYAITILSIEDFQKYTIGTTDHFGCAFLCNIYG